MPLSIDSYNKLILVTSPTTAVDAQTMHDFVQDYLATPIGMVEDGSWDAKGEILKPEGKIEDPTNPGVFSQIILILNPEWQIQFWGGSGYTRVFGGKIVGGVNDEPIKATGTAGDITVLESPVDGVTVAGGVSQTDVAAIRELMEADQFFDKSTGLLHYYRKGTTVDLITPKSVLGEQVPTDVSILE